MIIELAIAVAVTILVMLIPLRMVNIRRLRAWAARDASVAGQARADFAALDRQEEMRRGAHDAITEQTRVSENLLRAMRDDHAEVLEVELADHKEIEDGLHDLLAETRATATRLGGEITGLNTAHEETKVWANRILRDHEWHIAGKGNAHGKGVEIQWGCANCPAVVFAPAGSL